MKNIKTYFTATLISLISLSVIHIFNTIIANQNIRQEKFQANILPEVLVVGKRVPVFLPEVVVTAKQVYCFYTDAKQFTPIIF